MQIGGKIGMMVKELEDPKYKFTDKEVNDFLIGIGWIQGTINDYKGRIKNESKKSSERAKRQES